MPQPGPSPARTRKPVSAHSESKPTVSFWRVQQLIEIAALAPFLYVLAALYALMRQVLAWRRGWYTYGQRGTTLWTINERTDRGRPRRYVRCVKHQHLPLGVEEHMLAKDNDIPLRGRVVVPAPIGANLWGYVASDREPVGKWRWTWTCLGLFLFRRFTESAIETCAGCSSRPAQLLDEIHEALYEGQVPADS